MVWPIIDWARQSLASRALSGDPAMLARIEVAIAIWSSKQPELSQRMPKESHPIQRNSQAMHVERNTEWRLNVGLRINQAAVSRGTCAMPERSAKFWQWSDNAVDHAVLCGRQWTTFGWINRVPPGPNPRSLRNFHMQANGAEMLRLACCLGIENGIEICAPVHDAVLISSPLEHLENDVGRMHQ
jgi:hypothetical protein